MKDLFSDKNIFPVDIKDTMQQSYLDYSMSVIVGRAIPDARDGLKPVHRRILYAMKELNLEHNKPYKKSARVVGDVIGKYHPHGDMAVYDALVRMSQDFSMRYPLIDGQGNFGSLDGDSPAAMRYTEVRLSKIAEEMLKDLDKNSVDFVPNYDDSLKEPSVLPTFIPNLLMNGTDGIAVGFATKIPPNNLAEIIDACLAYLDKDGEISTDEILNYIKGPDFPTGGICFDIKSIKEAYKKGIGKITLRAKVKEEKIKNRQALVVYEIPYQVNKALLLQSIAQLVKDKKVEGIADLRDESNKEGVRIVIEIKKDEQPKVILNKLFKYTNLQTTFGVNMMALVGNTPRLLNIKDAIGVFVEHRIDVVKRRTSFLLSKAKDRAHILEGLLITLDNIDEVVAIIKSSQSTQEARSRLKERFKLSDRQTQAILDMKLARLVALEKQKLIDEYNQVLKDIEYYESILKDRSVLKGVIKDELVYVKQTYADERKTQILDSIVDIGIEDVIKDEQLIITFSKKGYVKAVPLDVYSTQHRGGKGRMAATFSDNDYITDIFLTNSLNTLLCFTNLGRVYSVKAYNIPKQSPSAKGRPIVNILNLQPQEFVKTIVPISEADSLFFATAAGTVKRSSFRHFENIPSNGKIAIRLNEQDSLVSVFSVAEGDEVIITTRRGMCVRFDSDSVRDMGRAAAGVRGINLSEGDSVVSAFNFNQDKHTKLIVVSQTGLGKLLRVSDIRKVNRGAKGVRCIKLKENDSVAGSLSLKDTGDVIVVTKNGKMIKMDADSINVFSRAARGVKLINLDEADSVVSIVVAGSEDEYKA
ncbi:DNA gyrase subunit A [Hippea maritima]|uniref:DNA gyrase subunit A n=1 Tax=Hippea maritima (strain ATCC 700847 / DSM 10411 / MH2) TaxID=760142 RepID=F2LWE3_HIPMA|nr:DNA gyrase subunit A [Hippea maritima]AEA32989.1 DNA gyrase, A subunit [Hippea maritima DSM 10411]